MGHCPILFGTWRRPFAGAGHRATPDDVFHLGFVDMEAFLDGMGTVKLSRICAFRGRILLDQRLIINDLAVAAGGENAAKLLNLTVPWRELVACILGSRVKFEVAYSAVERMHDMLLLSSSRRTACFDQYEQDAIAALSGGYPFYRRHCQVDEKLGDRPPRYCAPARLEPTMLSIKNSRQPQLDNTACTSPILCLPSSYPSFSTGCHKA